MKRRELGANLVECALIVVLICLVCVPSMNYFTKSYRKSQCTLLREGFRKDGVERWEWLGDVACFDMRYDMGEVFF